MSHWDFARPPDGEHDAPRPPRAAAAAYPPDLPGGVGDGAWPAHEGTTADERWPSAEEGWPPGGDGSPDGAWTADDDWEGEEDAAPYPITYERDDFAADPQLAAAADPQPAAAAGPPWEPWPPWEPQPPASHPAGLRDADTKVPAGDDAGERALGAAPRGSAGRGWRDTEAGRDAGAAGWTGRELGLPGDDPAGWAAGAAGRGGRRWLIPAGIVAAGAAVGAAAVILTSGGHPAANGSQGAGALVAPSAAASAPASAGPSPAPAGPLTAAQAKAVLAGYTAANNSANARRSDTQLSAVETGSSYAIDAGLYVTQSATGSAPYPAFSPAEATYYIPRGEPADGPRWFVAQVANAFSANPKKVTSDEYLLFTQAAPGGPWQDTIEPYQLPAASAPRIQAGADGLATAVSPDAATVAVAPSQLPAATAASLDGNGAGQDAIADPGSLADRADQRLWQAKVPGGNVTDAHRAATGADGQEFALLTAGGGALVFYTDAAELTITPPPGTKLHLTVPGLYSHAQALSQAGVSYLEQFAAYDPPAAAGATPHIVADYSGITGKN